MRNSRIRVILSILVGAIFTMSTFGLPVRMDQPFMEKAKDNLQSARNYLNRATADKGGHRNAAIAKVNAAIASVNSGIAYDNTHLGNRPRRNSTLENADLNSAIGADQPNMEKAREELQKAIDNLNRATADKGGWRNKAIDQARDAIKEVNEGIEYDRTHH